MRSVGDFIIFRAATEGIYIRARNYFKSKRKQIRGVEAPPMHTPELAEFVTLYAPAELYQNSDRKPT